MDWDDAYANFPHIPGAAEYPGRWAAAAAAFRGELAAAGRAELDVAYGPHPRERLDLFRPAGTPAGLAVFLHGGYWMAFDKSSWSHLAAGAVARGWAVALPSYTLCPEARISGITRQVARAVAAAAAKVEGPVALSGHSAGGHLVTRMACRDGFLAAHLRARLARVVSISGLHDLRPLLQTRMNATLGMNAAEAAAESAALQLPIEGVRVHCVVGDGERPEFRRQNALLANIWAGLGAETSAAESPGRHHFDVIADLEDEGSHLTRVLTGAGRD